MSAGDDAPTDLGGWHRKFAVETFNGAWDLIDKAGRTPAEIRAMIVTAMASRWHWDSIGTAENKAVGDWQVAHVLSLAGYGDAALDFATAAYDSVTDNGIAGFMVASTLEGIARAHAARGDASARDDYIARATAALEDIDDAEDRAHIASQIDSIPRA